jgi:hypothetical protein
LISFFNLLGNHEQLKQNEITLDLIDEETRFWVAQQVVDTKNTTNIKILFRKGKRVACTIPSTLISDGDQAFIQQFNKELWTYKFPKISHQPHSTSLHSSDRYKEKDI